MNVPIRPGIPTRLSTFCASRNTPLPFLIPTFTRPLTRMSRPRDIEHFIASYPGRKEDTRSSPNVDFYRNEGKMQPDNMKYEDWMNKYGQDFEELEDNHGFIQWLFPIREHGVNGRAVPLQSHEVGPMSTDEVILSRLLRSYTTMLAFYGIDFNEGHLQPSSQSAQRLKNLYHHPHNLLRITRILKLLSEIKPLQPHAAPLVLYFTAQHSEGRIDMSEGTFHGGSLDRWWSNVFRDEEERKNIRYIVKGRGGCGERRWGMKELAEWYQTRGKAGWTGTK